ASLTMKLPANRGMPTVIRPDGRIGVSVPYPSPFFGAAAGIKSSEAFLVDTATGKELAEIIVEGESSPFYNRPMLFSPDGTVLAANTGLAREQVHLYEVPSGKLLRTLEAGPVAEPPKKAKGRIGGPGFPGGRFRSTGQQMLFSPDGKALAFQPGPGSP